MKGGSTMDFFDVIKKRRSIRKFTQEKVDKELLVKCVEAARLSPQGANKQPMKYCVVTDEELVKGIFPNTKWAGYLYPHYTPQEGEEPTAYIGLLIDESIKKEADVDAGIVGQSIILAAQALGLGSCWLGSINGEKIRKILNIPDSYKIHSIIALGHPQEEPQVIDINKEDSICYFLDETGRLTVPKRKVEDILYFDDMQ